jgi:Asp/Glu/hydantoin racemase
MARILVINPNSSQSVTTSIDEALAPLRWPGGPTIDCVTLKEGPPGIETQAHIESVVEPIARRVGADTADAYVIACFSDPGLYLARETVRKPVVGIAESAILLAAGLAYRFGIIAILPTSIPRHLRYVRSLGFEHRLAGDRALGVGVEGLADRAAVIDKIVAAGSRLRDEDGAQVVLLGCAGMGRYRPELEDRLGIPVVDPCQAAVARATSLLALGYGKIA